MPATESDPTGQPNSQSGSAPHVPGPAAPRKNPARRRLIWIAVAGAAVAGLSWGIPHFVHELSVESTDDAFLESRIHPVGSRVQGQVTAVHFDDNQWVEEGQLLVELAPDIFEIEAAAAQADLDAAQAELDAARDELDLSRKTTGAEVQKGQSDITAARASISTSQAELAASEADLQSVEQDYARDQKLFERGVITQQELDHGRLLAESARARHKAAKQRVTQARAQVGSYVADLKSAEAGEHQVKFRDAQVRLAEADVKRAQARLDRARLNLKYAKIRAPASGHATQNSVQIGTEVQPGQTLLAVVPREVWVKANFKETQLGKIHPGQAATIHIDSYPDATFRGHVDSVQQGTGAMFALLPPQNATGNYIKVVQRIPVKIVFDIQPDPQRYVLSPGMSVVPEVDIESPPAHEQSPGQKVSLWPTHHGER